MSSGPGDGKVLHLPEEHDLYLSALYQQTDAAAPPADLEQRILNAAREAAEETVRQRQTRRRRRVPLPLAAFLLVLAGLLPLLLWYGYQGGFEYPTAFAPIPRESSAPGAPVVEPEPESLADPDPEPTPAERELAAIGALIESGRDAEAWERFGEFRRTHPEQRIPDALLDELAGVRARLLDAAGGP